MSVHVYPLSIPHQSGHGNETKQDIKSRKGRCRIWQTLKPFQKWFETLAALLQRAGGAFFFFF